MFNLTQAEEDEHFHSQNEVAQHFIHQLTERLYFIDSPNDIIAEMYFELGKILSREHVYSNADTVFVIAETYGYDSNKVASARADLIEIKAHQLEVERLTAIKRKEDIERAKSDVLMLVVFGLIGVLSLIIISIVIFKVVKNNRRKRGELIEVERSR